MTEGRFRMTEGQFQMIEKWGRMTEGVEYLILMKGSVKRYIVPKIYFKNKKSESQQMDRARDAVWG